MARTPQVIAAQRAIRNDRKRKSSEVATLKDENKGEEVLYKLLILNQDLTKIAKKSAKVQIDLSIMLKMNKEIATLAKEVSLI